MITLLVGVRMKSLRFFLAVVSIILIATTAFAKTGDTTRVPVVDKHLWNNFPGTVDSWGVFPPAGKKYEKILLRYRLTCPSPSCGQWDYTTKVILRKHTGIIDSVLKDAPNFTVGTSTVDSFAFSHDTTKKYSYNATKKTTDSSANGPTIIYFYNDPAHPFAITDSAIVFRAGYWNYKYDNTGKAIDSLYVSPDSVYHVTKIQAYYHYERIIPYEIGRLITPYGQGFPKNWTNQWTMDVTDYAFLLHDSVEFYSTYDGYTQGSLYSLDFDMIEGTPVRETYRIDVVYDGYYPWGNAADPISNYVKPKRFWLDPDAGVITYRTFTTGHGGAGPEVAAEFTDETHSIWVDGVKKYDQHLWRDDCGANPVYPQTGTWTLSRAGWCPGDKVDPWDFDMTTMAKPGDSITVDYRFADYSPSISGAGYAVHTQMMYSKGPQFNTDVALMAIKAPTTDTSYKRTNPICSQMPPMITIRNNGKSDLTSLKIRYGIDGATDNLYTWTGTLKYYQSLDIALPGIDLGTGSHTFNLVLDQLNNTADEYPNNNTGVTPYTMPKSYSYIVVLALKVDDLSAAGISNGIRYEVLDASDKVLYSRSDMDDGASIKDTFTLATGCYRFIIYDESELPEGLYPWMIQGAKFGSFSLKDDKKATIWNATSGNNLASFGPREIVPFMVISPLSVGDEQPIHQFDLSLYPNPAKDRLSVQCQGLSSGSEVQVSIFSLLGHEVLTRTERLGATETLDLDLQYLPAGEYVIRLEAGNKKISKRFIKE